jgi:hypothetical protein
MKAIITDKKQADLTFLAHEVEATNWEVAELQTVVSSLEEKSTEFTAVLATAENDRTTAVLNLKLMKDTVNRISSLRENCKTATKQTTQADNELDRVTINLTRLLDRLIFSAEFINKLANTINRKKSLVPLLSDDLVAKMAKASEGANNAVALTLTALQSCFTAALTSRESLKITNVENQYCFSLLQNLTGRPLDNKAEAHHIISAIGQEGKCDKNGMVKSVEDMNTKVQHEENLVRKAVLALETENSRLMKHQKALAKYRANLKIATTDLELEEIKYSQSQNKDKKKFNKLISKYQKVIKECSEEIPTEITEIAKAESEVDKKRQSLEKNKALLACRMSDLDMDVASLRGTVKEQQDLSLQYLITRANELAITKYQQAFDANERVTEELANANNKLEKATVKLGSQQLGLDAATAAALAA